ncbi:MAG: alpha/beta hydrolase [Acidimicrobiia bacterium]|nr:alpha/beta hydrolase [Acidimicrobiia bacterium]
MAIGLLVGWVAGLLSQSRWAMLLAPVVFVGVFELVRMGATGPTVDAPVASTYGILALVVGRGFHGVVALAPMVLGAALGAGAARLWAAVPRDESTGKAGRYLGRGLAGLSVLVMLVIAALVARPATTAPIEDTSGEDVPGSVAKLTTVEVGDRELGLMIRGSSMDNPVVLFLAGGPGGSERGGMRNHLEALEETLTVATWDQRGTGTSYPALDPTDTVTLEGQVNDTLEVTDYLRNRFGKDQIYLLGQSWGSTLGVLAVQAAPEKYRAFIGVGQMVSQLATDQIFYDDTLAWADENGNDTLADSLRDIGPPPYDRMLDYETALSYEHEVYPYDHSPNAEGEGGFSENFFVPEYTLTDQIHLLAAFMDTFAALYPQLQEIDFRETAIEFDVPMFFVQGAHEADGRAELFEDWYPMIQAPRKDRIVLDTSGHRPMFEQPDEFVDYMNGTVLAQTARK